MFTFTYHGYAAVEIHFPKRILIDPGIVKGKPLVSEKETHPSFLLVTHIHPEHLGNVYDIAKKAGCIVVGNGQVISTLRGRGLPSYTLEVLEGGKDFDAGSGVTITAYNLKHGGLFAPKNTAFHITGPDGSILHLGHANEYNEVSHIHPDLLCIPIAGKRRGTLNPRQAAQATAAIQPIHVLPMCGEQREIQEYLSAVNQLAPDTKILTLSPTETHTIQ